MTNASAMIRIDAICQGRWAGLAFALVLSCLNFGDCAWGVYHAVELQFDRSMVAASIVWEAGIGPVMTARLVAFVGAV